MDDVTAHPAHDARPPARVARTWVTDLALAAWIGLWIWAGITVAGQLRDLSSLSHTVTRVGVAATQVGQGLQALGSLPIVGDQVKGPAQSVIQAGQSAVASGRTSASSLHDASTLIGLAIALIPSVPLLVIYVPRRICWERERRALRRAERTAGGDPRFEAWLAYRADARLPYHHALGPPEPWTTGDAPPPGLADSELNRFGVRRTRARRPRRRRRR